MSIGNTKDYGNKGNNFPYQLRSLQLLSEILDAVSSPLIAQVTPNIKVSTGSDNLASGSSIANASFYNAGAAGASLTVNGTTVTLPAGVTVNYDAGANKYYKSDAFSWDATGTSLIVTYTKL